MNSMTPISSHEAEMRVLALKVASNMGVSLDSIQQNGKLTHALMHVRQTVIRKIHSTGRYKRQTIADFFGLSVCTVTASLTNDQKAKSLPFSPEEDLLIAAFYKKGRSIPQIRRSLPHRSASSIRRRLAHLKKTDLTISRTLEPTYSGEVPFLMLQLARAENDRMRRNL